ncbi:hypothetical protein llap_1637 [Limosa lapponica baueri]|uniref:Uncharacterized protein n=1 Tax=Limosa lapponica baueri TaxID=1758121 RepID=A0A2I0UPV7_LIMLA|nr:hypothetical protein llap_1637 [Limosa lapponica baueri]
MIRGLEHLSHEDRLRELGCSAWKRFRGDLIAAFEYLKGAYRRDGEGLFMKKWSNMMKSNGFKLKEGKFRLDIRYWEEILYCEGGEALEQVAQRSHGCPFPGCVQGQVGWGFEQPGLLAFGVLPSVVKE